MDHRGRSSSDRVSVLRSAQRWWGDVAAREGRFRAAQRLLISLWEFLIDSTPQRRRSRYGDAEFDWNYRVNTTSATVGWRDRLLGIFHSPYQPTEASLFHEMLAALHAETGCDFRDFVFLDLGSGKGRTLLMASDYPFRRILGLELLHELHQAAQNNLGTYKSETQKCFKLESICADATRFTFFDEPAVIYLFNPFPEAGLRRVLTNLQETLRAHPRTVYVLYHNPLLDHVFSRSSAWKEISRTHQYAIYAST